MLLKIMYSNGTYDMVKPSLLQQLISEKRLQKFYRSEQWVDITTDPIRKTDSPYTSPERRTKQN